ncbi:hypothetical protein SPOG_05668 [Schizosaccharomyces cryophilus OY26]|uniref:Uncharacterized protein n=1 Tax=Schizosaccharomyces cryophilus (strain OY26 / ATCC MYA-4695 / CBS 11777 / NBRC 106824 / NRRL Y48691) TaxID=653667 RepID=S9X1L8_SCHCR|nr:uncharacterized protein SPOG_05668 [Schizosaccharomyces cryophilus OY26]EPY50997.1 hypothetical protein SPOG_05668 [Schizosaccharomyces cryophilus OY26]
MTDDPIQIFFITELNRTNSFLYVIKTENETTKKMKNEYNNVYLVKIRDMKQHPSLPILEDTFGSIAFSTHNRDGLFVVCPTCIRLNCFFRSWILVSISTDMIHPTHDFLK